MKKVLAVLSSLFGTVSVNAATLTTQLPDTYADGIDFSPVLTVIGIVGGGVIGIYLGIKAIRWILQTFM